MKNSRGDVDSRPRGSNWGGQLPKGSPDEAVLLSIPQVDGHTVVPNLATRSFTRGLSLVR